MNEPVSQRTDAIPLSAVGAELEFSAWVGQLVVKHRAALVKASTAEGLLAEEALDAVQEAFETFLTRPEWRSLPRDSPDALKLLLTLVKNHARNARRKHSRKDEGMDAVTGNAEIDHARKQLDDLMVEAEEHLQLTGCISTLKEVQQTVVTARFFEGASGLDVAQELGLSAGNVAVILHRARESLRQCLESSRVHFGVASPR